MNDAIIFGTEEEIREAMIHGVRFVSMDEYLYFVWYYYRGFFWIGKTFETRPEAEA